MTPEELRDAGASIARDVAAGLMQSVAAGAAEFRRTMAELHREAMARMEVAETDKLTKLADDLESERESLRSQIATATGLKKVALERRLAQNMADEQRLIERVQGEQSPKAIATGTADQSTGQKKRDELGRFRS